METISAPGHANARITFEKHSNGSHIYVQRRGIKSHLNFDMDESTAVTEI